MAAYEYKVVPSPARGDRARGIKGPDARFAHALERVMNGMAAEGWEYQRAETLPSEERSGLTGSVTQWRNLLVFRRARTVAAPEVAPMLLEPPQRRAASPTDDPGPAPRSAGLGVAGLRLTSPLAPPVAPRDSPTGTAGSQTEAARRDTTLDRPGTATVGARPGHTASDAAVQIPAQPVETTGKKAGFASPPTAQDNGVEETDELSGMTSALRARALRVTSVPSGET